MQITESVTQIKELVNSSRRILIVTRRNPDIDGVGALLAWQGVLSQREKVVTLLAEDFVPAKLPFLAHINRIQTSLPPKSLVVSIDLQNNPIEKINYETKDGKFELTITPKRGSINTESIEFFQTNLNFDLVVAVSSPKLSFLGEIAHLHREFLEQISLINIDSTADNDLFGKLNLVDQASSSTCEILAELFRELNWPLSTEVATALLSGIMHKTRSFQKGVTPRTFGISGRLVEAGAGIEALGRYLFGKAGMENKSALDAPDTGTSIRDNDQPMIR